ncbi:MULTISPECIES: heavy-metal-associated domain-containing protein [Oscillospiraceae]|uniref:Copper chaperone CopZ n=1 Tax=Harryflintia acetispora TaxID=1849041 RepID=A0A9X8Y8G5_9FIRM|nr:MULTISPECIES: heavy metal-associated domain-containing protein [Oscillospiraceae]RGB67949.1 heavy-metal-associated domain-containing protein [Harryflintia acetispora]TCL43475.1 copper chaperone CopZ [Harryflintia acetispora]
MANETAWIMVENVDGKRDLGQIKRQLDTLHGVSSVSVNEQTNRIAVDYDSSGASYDKIENCLNKMGYQIIADASDISTR